MKARCGSVLFQDGVPLAMVDRRGVWIEQDSIRIRIMEETDLEM